MNNDKFSLTGNEFLDFLSWCEAVGIDFPEKENQEDEQQDEQESQKLIMKLKGRDKYE
jgi:hypothetical protein